MARHPGQLLWIFLAYGFGLWWYSVPFTGDEKVYVSTAMEMWLSGDWIHPRLLGETSYFKPPIQYWATLLGWSVFGFNLFGTFIPSVLATLATAWLLGEISILLGQTKERVTAGIWFAGSAGTLTYGTTAQMEIWTVLFLAAAWWAALRYLRSLDFRWLYLALGIAGLSALVKSPLYSALWVLSFWIFLLIRRRRVPLKHFVVSHILGVLIGLSWFVVIYFSDWDRFWNHYVIQETLSKRGGNNSSILRFFGDFCTFMAPWLLFILGARPVSRDRAHFLLSWCLLPLLFFSSFPYRTETYLYPLLPAFALAMDWIAPGRVWVTRVFGALVAAAILVLGVLIGRSGMVSQGVQVLWILSALCFAWACYTANWKRVALASLFLIFVVRVAAFDLGESDIRGLREASARHPGRELVFWDGGRNIWHEVGLFSVAVGQPSSRVHDLDAAEAALKAGALLVVSDQEWELITAELQRKIPIQIENWQRWKRGFSVPKASNLAQKEANRRLFKIVRILD